MMSIRYHVLFLLLVVAQQVGAAPVVSNISAVQRPNTKLVDVNYDVAASGVSNVKISLQISSDGGATFTIPAVTVTGDVGVNVAVGTGKQLTWNAGVDWANQYSAQICFRVTADDLLIPNFSRIVGGEFTMGDSLDGVTNAPVHNVNVSTVYVLKTEVSKSQWDAVRVWALNNGYPDLASASSSSANSPAGGISWYDALKWCNARSEMEALTPCYYSDEAQTTVFKTEQVNVTNAMVKWDANGYRLPTEAEWEKASRGGVSGRRFPWGDTITHNEASYHSDIAYAYDVSVTRGVHPSYPTSVGFFAANAFGLSETSGSLWEWCWDWYDATYYGSSPANDPMGPVVGSNRARRGGAYQAFATRVRCSHRDFANPVTVHPTQGFRTARGGSQLTGAIATATSASVSVITAMPEIAVEQPTGTDLLDESTNTNYGVVPINSSSSIVTYTIRNTGTFNLLNLAISKSGTNSNDFVLGTLAVTSIVPGGSATFTVIFTPVGGATGSRTATLHIGSNDSDENPFDITLNGEAYSTTQDVDNDGMNDWGEYKLSALGFDWQVPNNSLVSTYYNNADAAGLYNQTFYNANRTAGQNDVINSPNAYSLYTLSQVQNLNVGVPLLQRNPATGEFTLTIGVDQSTNLTNWTPLPMTVPQTIINSQGKVEFRFTAPDNAAFFRLQTQPSP